MIPILPIGEVIIREIRSGKYDLVVEPIELHMLEAPPFIDTLG